MPPEVSARGLGEEVRERCSDILVLVLFLCLCLDAERAKGSLDLVVRI